jgi:hypothetical protein
VTIGQRVAVSVFAGIAVLALIMVIFESHQPEVRDRMFAPIWGGTLGAMFLLLGMFFPWEVLG